MVASGSVAAIQRFAHVSFRKMGSISTDGGVAELMNTGWSVCDLNRHTLSLFNTHSLIKSATIIGELTAAWMDKLDHRRKRLCPALSRSVHC
jgi:hypothetical protein